MVEQAIVLAAHGSRHPGAMAALGTFRDRLAADFPNWRVEIARTVGRKHGPASDFGGARRVAAVLETLVADGVRRVVVQSLHVVPGEEYHEMLAVLGRYLENGGARLTVSVGAPLLADLADVDAVAATLVAELADRRGPNEGLVIMGHGAPPPGAGFYAALGERLTRLDPLAHCGTMPRERGLVCPDLGRIREALGASGVRTAWLRPFFTVAGAHACNDLAGKGPTSWRGILEAAGIRCRPALAGLIEAPAFTAVWRAHLRRAMKRLG
jgi:sirohydrochlorin cobaltochelatase